MSTQHCHILRLFLTASILPVLGPRAAAVGIPAQRLAAEVTVATLPEPLHGFFATRVDGVVERTVEPDGAWRNDPRTRLRDDWHYLDLDAAANGGDWAARLQAARAFPAQAQAAQRIFRDHNVKHGGRLPWELDGLVNQLADAFRSGDAAAIVGLAGYVVHFSTDAADPFATSQDRTGAGEGCPTLVAAVGDRWYAHRDAAQRIGWELIRRNTERYRGQLDPREIRFELGVDDVPFAVVECMLTSFEQLGGLCAADIEVLTQMGVVAAGGLDTVAFAARLDEYYLLLDARAGEVCVQNLRRSVRLAATLIVTAWIRAGSPDPVVPSMIEPVPSPTPMASATDTRQTASSEDPAQATPQPAAARFLASRKSKVYHRPECSHAARITAANRVEYQSSQEAEGDGKRPCQTCRPDQAETGGPQTG